MKIIKTASYDLSKYQFTPQQEEKYRRLDGAFLQIAEMIQEVEHQLYTGSHLPPDKIRALEDQKDRLETTRRNMGDQLFNMCEAARRRIANPPQPKVAPSKGQKWLGKAVRRFGYTADPREAGYLHPNGRMLDFSGKNKGRAQPGQRALDHRDVTSLDQELSEISNRPAIGSWAGSMRTFMMHSGAIRIHYGASGMWVDMAAIPTKKQLQQIVNLSRNLPEVLVQARIVDGEKWEKHIQADPPNQSVSAQKVMQAVQEASRFLGKGNEQ